MRLGSAPNKALERKWKVSCSIIARQTVIADALIIVRIEYLSISNIAWVVELSA
jgi:hypothetical protein